SGNIAPCSILCGSPVSGRNSAGTNDNAVIAKSNPIVKYLNSDRILRLISSIGPLRVPSIQTISLYEFDMSNFHQLRLSFVMPPLPSTALRPVRNSKNLPSIRRLVKLYSNELSRDHGER